MICQGSINLKIITGKTKVFFKCADKSYVSQLREKNMKKIGRFASEIFRMIKANPDRTIGELFQQYKINFPNTLRSRNEVAKRVNELENMGLVFPSWLRRKCQWSGREAYTWLAATEVSPTVQFSSLPAESGLPEPTDLPQPINLTTEKLDGCRCCIGYDHGEVAPILPLPLRSFDSEDQEFAYQVRRTLHRFMAGWLFKLLPKKMRVDAVRLDKILKCFE